MALLLQAFLNANRDPQRRQPVEYAEVMGWLGHTLPPAPPPPARSPEELAATMTTLHGFYRQGNGTSGPE